MSKTDIEMETYKDTAITLLMLLMNQCGVETENEQETIWLIAECLKKEVESETQRFQKDNRELRLSNLTMLEVNDELQKDNKELREAAKFYRTKLIQHGINIDRKKYRELLNKEVL